MPFPLAAIPAIASVGSSIAGAFGKRKKPAPIDVTPLAKTIQQGASRQRQAVGNVRPGLAPFTGNLVGGTNQAVQEAEQARRGLSSQYLSDVGRTFDNTGEEFANTLSRRLSQQQPAAQQALRENLAATGGLNRGAASRASTNLAGDFARSLAEGQENLALNQAQEKSGAIRAATEKIYGMDEDFVNKKLGVSRDTLATVFQTGREDLIREAEALLGIDRSESDQMLDLQKFQINQNYARSADAAQGRNSLLDTLLRGGLQGVSSIAASRGGNSPR